MGEAFFCVFISLDLTCLIWYLFYSYCPDFAMQKCWGWPSLFYDFGEVSINHSWSPLWRNVLPCAHRQLFMFSYLLSGYSLVNWYLCLVEILHALCGLMFA